MQHINERELAGGVRTKINENFRAHEERLNLSGVSSVSGLSALEALSLASSRRIDLVMIGDSNQAGFNIGLEKALASRYPIYASPIMSRTAPRVYSTSYYSCNLLNPGEIQNTGTPDSLTLRPSTPNFLEGYVIPGNTYSSSTAALEVPAQSPLNVNDAINGWVAFGVSSAFAGGSFNAGIRRGEDPWTALATSGVQSTTQAQDGLRMLKVSIPSASRNHPIQLRYQLPPASITGPWVGYFLRVERDAQASGVSVHTLYGVGGQSAWDAAYSLQSASDKALTMFFSEARRLQISAGYSPIVVVYINLAFNDRNEANRPTLGPARIADTGRTPQEYIDNLRGIKKRITDIWDLNGWDRMELHWLFVPGHRTSDPEDDVLVGFRSALSSSLAAEAQSSIVDLGLLMTQADAVSAGWYLTPSDFYHLSPDGYDAVSSLIVSQIP